MSIRRGCLLAALLLSAVASSADAYQIMLSWDSCTIWLWDQYFFTGPGTYRAVLSATGVPENVELSGFVAEIIIRAYGPLPDME